MIISKLVPMHVSVHRSTIKIVKRADRTHIVRIVKRMLTKRIEIIERHHLFLLVNKVQVLIQAIFKRVERISYPRCVDRHWIWLIVKIGLLLLHNNLLRWNYRFNGWR